MGSWTSSREVLIPRRSPPWVRDAVVMLRMRMMAYVILTMAFGGLNGVGTDVER
jgi:hypothetical protein